jgi:transcriptional regulator with XRE-family HTH domain
LEKEESLVKKTCQELGITQKELANITGYTEQAISRWNKGSEMSKSVEVLLNTMIELSKYKKVIPELTNIKNNLDKLIQNSL